MAAKKSPQTSVSSEILGFIDLPGGELDDFGKGVLSEVGRLAQALETGWSAVSFAGVDPVVLEGFAPYGPPGITLIEGAGEIADCLEAQGQLLAQAARELGAEVVMLPHNDLGAALAPLLAAELQAALFTEALAYEPEAKGLKVRRQALGTQVVETRRWDRKQPLVLTIEPRGMSAVVLPTMPQSQPQVNSWHPAAPVEPGPTRIIERIPPDPQTVDVAEAEVLFSAGLGCNRQSFEQLQELTRMLNASLGVTRPVYDLGWTGFERMVGQTGKTVAPRFYLALGISGSMHHVGGIKDAKKIVSVNIDPKVPIFPNSDEGFVADLREVLPLLLERVRSATGGTS